MEENKPILTEEEIAEKKRKSKNRIFGFLLILVILLSGGLIYEIVDLILKNIK